MPDHPSWPAELVEKGARALAKARTGFGWGVINDQARSDFQRETRAVLSALSGDLVPREERERHDAWLACIDGGWSGYRAMCSCGWQGEERANKSVARVESIAHEQSAPTIELVPRSQADALAEALEEIRPAVDRLLHHDLLVLIDSRLASYRSSSSTETEG